MRKFLFLFLFGIIGFGQMKAQSFQMGKSPQAANDKELIIKFPFVTNAMAK